MNKTNLYDLDRPGLASLVSQLGYRQFHADQIWDYLYRQKVASVAEMHDLRSDLWDRLHESSSLTALSSLRTRESRDGTRKYLLGLQDGKAVEAVLMPYRNRNTGCISTQVGCAMGCVFCATGQMGYERHLTAGEIVAQVLFLVQIAADQPTPQKLRNIVFMGMGEPLHNYQNTLTAINILTDAAGLALGPRYITLSTVGIVPAIRRLAQEELPLNLAVSLHAATDDERSALVPAARRWPLQDLIDACRYYADKRGRRIFFEWALIASVTDTPEQAHALGHLLQGLDAHVNLIPLNPTLDYQGLPSKPASIDKFRTILGGYDLPNTIRQRRGLDIEAGCGQLREQFRATH